LLSPGTIARRRVPSGPGVRGDGGYDEGDTISQFYDNLVGKLVVWGADRKAAIRRMLRALGELEVGGVRTTVPADVALLDHPDFVAGNHSTRWVEEEVDPALLTGAAAEPALVASHAGGEAEAVPLEERTIPVEVDGKRFSVRVWLPEVPAAGETRTQGAPRGRRVNKPKLSAGGGGAGGRGPTAPPQRPSAERPARPR